MDFLKPRIISWNGGVEKKKKLPNIEAVTMAEVHRT
jgi:hypothetical protein